MFNLISFMFVIFVFCVPGELKTLKKKDVIFPYGCVKVFVEISVGSFSTSTNSNSLLIRYENKVNNYGDWVGVFRTDPKTKKVLLKPVYSRRVGRSNGHNYISIKEIRVKPKNLGFESKCLDYYAGYFDKCHNCLGVTCLKTEPDWMWTLKDKIGPKKIKNVVIPGTHQSAWYTSNVQHIQFEKRFQTQDDTILGQLIFGVRYIHMSVGYYPDEDSKWWAQHPYDKLCPIDEIINEIRSFLEHTNEIVIFDINKFHTEFDDPNVHIWFIEHLKLKLGDLATPNSLTWETTFDEVWKTKRRLIIAYNFVKAVVNSDFLWYSVQHKGYYGLDMDLLHSSLTKLMKRPPNFIWAAMGHLTPDISGLENKNIHVEKLMIDIVNSVITRWFRDPEWLRSSNIILVDFIRNSGIIRAAIEWNSGECH